MLRLRMQTGRVTQKCRNPITGIGGINEMPGKWGFSAVCLEACWEEKPRPGERRDGLGPTKVARRRYLSNGSRRRRVTSSQKAPHIARRSSSYW